MSEANEQNKDCPGVDSNMAGKAEQCGGCPNAKICASGPVVDPDVAFIKGKLAHFKKIIAVMSGKGGVGKSTITRNLAESLANKEVKTIIIDLDLSGPSIPRLTNTEGVAAIEINNTIEAVRVTEYLSCISVGYYQDDIDVYSSSVKTKLLKNIFLNSNFDNYELMIIDTPPNITDEHLGLVNFIKPDSAVIVTTPQIIAFQDVIRQISFCRKANINIKGIIENMKGSHCKKCNTFNDIFNDCDIENKCLELDIPYLGSLPINTDFGKISDAGKPIKHKLFDAVADLLLTE